MDILTETKIKLSELIDTNRTLTRDLDESRREATELIRQREHLRQQLAELRRKRPLGEASGGVAQQLRRAEAERDAARRELQDSMAALDEIREYLLALLGAHEADTRC